VKGKYSQVGIRIAKGHDNISFKLPVAVIMDEYEFPVILGRNEFFDRFKITFKQREERVILKIDSGKAY